MMMKSSWLSKLDYRLPLELLVGVTLALYMIQEILLYEVLSEKVFIVSAMLAFLGSVLGLLSTSYMLIATNLLLVFLGSFLLYFKPIIMSDEIKLFLIVIIPIYSFIAYLIKKSVYVRKLMSFREEDIYSYLKFRDPLTGYRTVESFYSKYQQFIDSLAKSEDDRSRVVVVSLFYVDFYDQYFERNARVAEQMVRDMAEKLLHSRNPEELFFYLKNGTFVVLSIIYDSEIEKLKFKRLNMTTKENFEGLVFETEQVQNITIRKSELYINRKTAYTADQVLDYLYRRSETDLAIEYI